MGGGTLRSCLYEFFSFFLGGGRVSEGGCATSLRFAASESRQALLLPVGLLASLVLGRWGLVTAGV